MRKVAILTPSHDGTVHAHYMVSMANSIKLCAMQGIELCPIVLPGEAILSRARNNLFAMAMESDAQDIIWIDADMGWNPDWIMKLLLLPVDFVSGTARRKMFAESYVCRANPDDLRLNQHGLLSVLGTGFAFTRMSRVAMETLWNASEPYTDEGNVRHDCFAVSIEDGKFHSEDITACNKIRRAGNSIYLDPSMTCSHSGSVTFEGDFLKFLIDHNQLKEAPAKVTNIATKFRAKAKSKVKAKRKK